MKNPNRAAERRSLLMAAGAAALVSICARQALACFGAACTPTSCVGLGLTATQMTHTIDPNRPIYPVDVANRFGKNMILLSNLPLASIGGGAGSSLYGWVDPLTNHEYAIMGRSTGTAFVDITNPSAPKYVAELPRVSGSSATSWREPKVYQNTVYIGVDGTSVGMQVMDLTKLRNYAGTTMTLAADRVYNGVTKIHTLAINKDSGFLYADGTNVQSGGMHIIDVRDPLNPVAAGGYSGDLYTHESQVVTYHGPDARYTGHELAFNSNGKSSGTNDTFSIVDVTNKSAITGVASAAYPGASFIHQGWLTEDQRYFFQNDELDEQGGITGGHTRTHLWDVSNLTSPVYKGYFDQKTTSIDHNLYVKDGFLFETNYTTGLRMFKLGDLSSGTPSKWMTEVAYYDTYAPNDNAVFSGAWNNYPFFPSGNIAISDINGGLFIVRPTVAGWGGVGSDVPEPAAGALLATAVFMRRRRAN